MQGFGKAGKEGVLVKGSEFLDTLTKAKAIVLDKTGTITKGNFEVSKVILAKDISEEELINITAIAESMSNHPIAKSIVNKSNVNINTKDILEYKEISGMGVKVKYKEDEIFAGNAKLLDSENIKYYKCNEIGAIVYVARNKKYLGAIVISDIIKEDSKEAIESIDKTGIKNVYMLTGDNKEVAQNVGEKVGIQNIYSNLLPQEKVEKMKEIKEKYGTIVAVGDGINDSPLLALADVGISIGNTGSDLAIESSDMVIMDGKLSNIANAIKTAKKTKRIVMQNIYFSIGIKVIVLALGAMGISTMWEAVFADVGVTFITVLNSLRIFRK
ncbi:MAG: HAD-IC family P-type ATPase [Clostridia bacterium]|nr:HAD-IC family P-type ATPase [Clostridia bacterium]